MFKVNSKDGKTLSFKHENDKDIAILSDVMKRKSDVTGLSIHLSGTSYVFPSKTISESDSIGFDVSRKPTGEVVALSVWVHTRDTRTNMTVFCGGKSRMCRVDVTRLGFRAGS